MRNVILHDTQITLPKNIVQRFIGKQLVMVETQRGILIRPRTEKKTNSSIRKIQLIDLKGMGKELWGQIDAQDYVNQLRTEWQ